MKRIAMFGVLVCLTLGGCVSIFARKDHDRYEGASATFQGNGRTTTMVTSQPATQPAVTPIKQSVPGVGEVFRLRVNGKTYNAMQKTDGKVYIIQEVR